MTDFPPMESTPTNTMTCPLCRLPMRHVGQLVAFTDHAGKHFAFAICAGCCGRLERLPVLLQSRQLDIAISQLTKHPERYRYHEFPERTAAQLFVSLEASRLRGEIGQV